jgi:hypothetical protein
MKLTILNYLKKYGDSKVSPSKWNKDEIILTYSNIQLDDVKKELKSIYAVDTDVNITSIDIICYNEKYHITEEPYVDDAEAEYKLIVREQPNGNNVQGKELPLNILEKLNHKELTLKILADSEIIEK